MRTFYWGKSLAVAVLLVLSLSNCKSSPSEDSSGDSGAEEKDDDTGSSVYVPEGRGDAEAEEGSSEANQTTGAYLAITGDVFAGSPSVNISSKETVTDADVKEWILTIPLNKLGKKEFSGNKDNFAIFYHIQNEDGEIYYGALAPVSFEVSSTSVTFNLVGLGNYQLAILANPLTKNKKVESEDLILTKAQAKVWATSTFLLTSGKLVVARERDFVLISDDENHDSFTAKGEEEGLKSPMVRDVVADGSDNIFAATRYGLAFSKDEGESFETLTDNDGLTSVHLNKVTIGNDGKLYIASESGISVVDPSSEEVVETYTSEDGLASDRVFDIAFDSNSKLFAATDNGISYLASGGSEFETLDKDNSDLAHDRVNALYVDAQDRLWAATEEGLSVKGSGGSTFVTIADIADDSVENSIDETSINDVYVTSANKVIIAKTSGISSFTYLGAGNIDDVENFENEESLNADRTFTLHVDTGDHFLISKANGVSEVNVSGDDVEVDDLEFD